MELHASHRVLLMTLCGLLTASGGCEADARDLAELSAVTLEVVNNTSYELTLPANESETRAGWVEFTEHPDWLYLPRHSAPVSAAFFCDEALQPSASRVVAERRLAPGESVEISYLPIRFNDGRETGTLDGTKYCVDPAPIPEGRYDLRVCARRASYPCKPDAQALMRECVEVPIEVSPAASTTRVVFEQDLFAHTDDFCNDGQ